MVINIFKFDQTNMEKNENEKIASHYFLYIQNVHLTYIHYTLPLIFCGWERLSMVNSPLFTLSLVWF